MEDKSVFPVISPGMFYSHLNSEVALLVDEKRRRTLSLNQFQARIVDLLTGSRSIEELCGILSIENPKIYTCDSITEFIGALVEKRYVHCPPVALDIARTEREKSPLPSTANRDYFYPDRLSQITISITDKCCLHCDYCSQRAQINGGHSLSKDIVMDLIDEAYSLGAKSFGIFGGEPLLYEHLGDIVNHAYCTGFSNIKLFTKGTLIDEFKAKELRSIGINNVQVSCDSYNQDCFDKTVGIKGAFKAFYRGLYNLIDSGIDVDLKIVATKNNIHEIPRMIDGFSSIGVKKILIEVVVPVGRADFDIIPEEEDVYDLENFIQTRHDKYDPEIHFKYLKYGTPQSCAGGITNLMVFADGYVAPCDKWYDFRLKYNFGNIFDKSLTEIWANGDFNLFRNLSSDISCRECTKQVVCRGGCKLHSMLAYSDIYHADIACSKVSGKHEGLLFKDNEVDV